MIRVFCRLLLVLFLIGPGTLSGLAEEEGFVPLFDGKSFEGWEGNRKTFRIEDGSIVGGTLTERIPHNDFLCTTREFGDFELRLEAKLMGAGNNAGIQLRSQRIPDHHEVIGYQCDMGSAWNRPIWGALYDESRRRKVLAEGNPDEVQKALKENDWNEFVIRCQGSRIQIWLNDCLTVDYTEKDDDIARQGIIGLQIHGGKPAEAWYRKLRIKTLGGR